MVFEWTKGLSLSLETVDSQHKELMMRADELLKAMNEKRGVQEVRSILIYLEVYVKDHFNAEEKLMEKTEYPFLEEHRQIHQIFTLGLSNIKEEFLKNPNSTIIQLQVQHSVCEWINNHIMKEDKLYADYIRAKK